MMTDKEQEKIINGLLDVIERLQTRQTIYKYTEYDLENLIH